ncbi:MAG: hypothetical protein WCK98_04350 [bacterium]
MLKTTAKITLTLSIIVAVIDLIIGYGVGNMFGYYGNVDFTITLGIAIICALLIFISFTILISASSKSDKHDSAKNKVVANNNKIITVKNFFIGLSAFLSLSLLGGFNGIGIALGALGLAVVCTAGIGLVIVIPLLCLFGWFVKNLSDALTGKNTKQGVITEIQEKALRGEQIKTTSFSPAQQSLNTYIYQVYKNPGVNLTIINQLKQKGWNDQQINLAIDLASKTISQ